MHGELEIEAQQPWLEHFPVGCGQAKRTPIANSSLIIGRAESAELQIDSSRVSRDHARVEAIEGKYFLQDLGSTNGTFVNGQRIERTELGDGDVILIADTELTFLLNAVGRLRRMATQPIPTEAAGPRRDTHPSTRDQQDRIIGLRRSHEELLQQLVAVEVRCVVERASREIVARYARPTAIDVPLNQRGASQKHLCLRRMQSFRAIALERATALGQRSQIVVPIESWEASEGADTLWHLVELQEGLPRRCSLAASVNAGDAVDVIKVRELCGNLKGQGVTIACHDFIGGEAQIRDLQQLSPGLVFLADEMTRGISDDQRQLRRLAAVREVCCDLTIIPVIVNKPSQQDLDACIDLGFQHFIQDPALPNEVNQSTPVSPLDVIAPTTV